jgi:hypothetical protein
MGSSKNVNNRGPKNSNLVTSDISACVSSFIKINILKIDKLITCSMDFARKKVGASERKKIDLFFLNFMKIRGERKAKRKKE